MMGLTLFLVAMQTPPPTADRAAELIRAIRESGRVVEIAAPSSRRLEPEKGIAPGAPPLLSFRYLEGRERHRFGKLDLIVDDAGH